jgi:hypothetical protein
MTFKNRDALFQGEKVSLKLTTRTEPPMDILASRFNQCLLAIWILLMLPWCGLAVVAEPSAQNSSSGRVARLLEELTNAPAPSGFKGRLRQIVERELQSSGARISHDGLGSVIGEIPGASDRPRVMVTAHMDEAGLMVQRVREDGFITFKTLGGWFDQALVGERWTTLTRRGPLLGISCRWASTTGNLFQLFAHLFLSR